MGTDYASMRRQYTRQGLLESDMAGDPIAQFREWFAMAEEHTPAEWLEVNAMTLSTADARGGVTSRIVLLKGLSDEGFVFYSNYASQKGQQIAENPRGAINFFWPHLERQVRVVGVIEKIDRERSLEYFRSRPLGSQLGAHASNQSSVVAGREELEQRYAELEQRYKEGDIPLPDDWGGYCLEPREVEFWQGRSNRLHDRLRYRRNGDDWVLERLAP